MNDPFELLGLEPRFALDLAELDEQHRQRSLMAHPDRLRGRTAAERRLALSTAMSINEAHRLLRDPGSRALALLAHRGHLPEELPAVQHDPESLMKTLERREALRDALTSGATAAIRELEVEVRGERQRALEAVERSFHGTGRLGPAELQDLSRALSELRYLERFLAEAEAAEA